MDYDFRSLNDKEFEILVNDLLSIREGKVVDRFKAGKDGGIDGRFFCTEDGEKIIQSKHWLKSGINALIAHLEKTELPKIQKLSPDRYILATSLEMSNSNKKKIMKALSPYIVSEKDILGQENLNDLLSKHKDIEKKHYKLWLSSSNVLNLMLNAALSGRSEEKRKQIIKSSNIYVVTENHRRALKKLNKTNSLIITGEGGIGKTSLADQLAYYCIAKGFELCVIENDISEAEAIFEKGKKQVFYFDDFLGRNYLTAITDRKESRVLDFIDRVANDKSKKFILTSRTTVLNQGRVLSDLLDIKKIDEKEYEIRITSLSNLDKAHILYNHIWHGALNEEYIEQLYIENRYFKIINHRNYNPRLIAFITDPQRFPDIPPNGYWNYVLDALDNPQKIWADVFDNQIDDLTRLAVCLTVFNGKKISEEDLKKSFSELAIDDGLVGKTTVNNKYNTMIRAAVGSMLQRTILYNKNVTFDLFNPSVADFILGRYLDDTQSLKSFFLSLETVSSIENLWSLRKNDNITEAAYISILEDLSISRINSEIFYGKIEYFLTLSKRISYDYQKLSNVALANLVSIIKKINSIDVPADYIEEVCSALNFAYLQQTKDQGEIKDSIIEFIVRCSEANLQHEDFEELNILADNLTLQADEAATVRGAIKKGLNEYWENNIHDAVANGDVLDSYLRPDEEDDAFRALRIFLTDKLEAYGFTEDEIWDKACSIDIKDWIYENMKSEASAGYERFNASAPQENSSSVNESALVHDLFDRGGK